MKDVGLLILRLAGIGLALGHGLGKITSLSTGGGEPFIEGVANLGFPYPMVFAWASALSEFAGGLLVALGVGTRVAASFAAFNMFVAAFLRHHFHQQVMVKVGLLQVSEDVLKEWGNPELAVIYLLVFLALLLLGGGRVSLDSLFSKRRK